MKKFFSWYFILFLVLLISLIAIQFLFKNKIYGNISIISAKDILNQENIYNNSNKKENKKPDDVGNINTNYAANYKNASSIYNGNNEIKKVNVEDVGEVQVFLNNGFWGDNVYYFSNKSDNINFINNYITDISTYQYYNEKKGYEYECVTFVLKNKSVVYQYIYINEDIKNYIKNNFNQKEIFLSKTAQLCSSNENFYRHLNYSDDEYEKIITCLTQIKPIQQGFEANHGSAVIFDVEDDLIWAYQFENGKEVSYTYKTTDSKELVDILDKLNEKKFKEVIESDSKISYIGLKEYKDNQLLYRYEIRKSQESLMKNVKNFYNENYPKKDFFILWVFLDDDSFAYLKVPISQEFREMISKIGGKIYED